MAESHKYRAADASRTPHVAYSIATKGGTSQPNTARSRQRGGGLRLRDNPTLNGGIFIQACTHKYAVDDMQLSRCQCAWGASVEAGCACAHRAVWYFTRMRGAKSACYPCPRRRHHHQTRHRGMGRSRCDPVRTGRSRQSSQQTRGHS